MNYDAERSNVARKGIISYFAGIQMHPLTPTNHITKQPILVNCPIPINDQNSILNQCVQLKWRLSCKYIFIIEFKNAIHPD